MTIEFNRRYAEVSVKANDVKAKLMEVLKDAKELSKDAKALYDFANDRLYYEDDEGTLRPMCKWLDYKMSNLESWTDCICKINSAITSI